MALHAIRRDAHCDKFVSRACPCVNTRLCSHVRVCEPL